MREVALSGVGGRSFDSEPSRPRSTGQFLQRKSFRAPERRPLRGCHSYAQPGCQTRLEQCLLSVPKPPYTIEFYEDANGDQPVRRWLKEELTPRKRRALGQAMNEVLQHLGVGVCGTEFGKQLGGGLFEFRLRRDLSEIAPSERRDAAEKILLRVFCHAHGRRLILLLAGYDKGDDPASKRQQQEIRLAKKRLADWLLRQAHPGRRRRS